MPSRRAVLTALAGGTLGSLAGCGGPAEGTEREFGLTTTGAEGVPGQAVGIELTARGVGELTYRVDALPSVWQVVRGDFDPESTSVREMYPPELVWEPVIGTVEGTFIVEIGSNAAPGEYSLPIEVRAGESDETVVSTAIITVEGPTETPTQKKPTGTRSPRNPTGILSPRRQSPPGTD